MYGTEKPTYIVTGRDRAMIMVAKNYNNIPPRTRRQHPTNCVIFVRTR